MIKEKIDEVLMLISFMDEPPSKEDKLKEDLGIDSLRIVELIVDLESKLNITINESSLNPKKMETVEDIYNLIGEHVGGCNYDL